ncbi:MAG: acyl carrier protein [Verrucomicrobia subdivision 3 bacterium]|nr:acyl carrier protein [Limisphaerales bacterium]
MALLSESDKRAVDSVLVEELHVAQEQLTPEARFDEDLGADSLTLVEIAIALEEHFNLSIPDETWDGVKTVGDLYEMLAELLYKTKAR